MNKERTRFSMMIFVVQSSQVMESKLATTIAKLVLECSDIMTSEAMLISVFLLYLYVVFRYNVVTSK